jgi:pimeloyl-ACP methyl ester carboxylesterase
MATPISTSTTRTIDLPSGVSITFAENGVNDEGSGVLLLHGGAGPRTMAGLAAALSQHVYVITPTHPGFEGIPRTDRISSVADLATAYLDLLDALGLTGVMVIGSSIGGWIASEMATRDAQARLGCVVLINATGVKVEGEEVTDVRGMAPADISKLSFANPAFRPDFASFTDEQRAVLAANQQAMAVYSGETLYYDPALRGRLQSVTVPVLAIWGEQDGVAPIGYGRAYAASFPNGHFVPVPEAGHFPQVEQLAATMGAIGDFVDTVMKPSGLQ